LALRTTFGVNLHLYTNHIQRMAKAAGEQGVNERKLHLASAPGPHARNCTQAHARGQRNRFRLLRRHLDLNLIAEEGPILKPERRLRA
jgi:hypothetical protein